MIRFKENCIIKSYHPDFLRGLFWFEDIRRLMIGPELEMVVTSMNDSKHRVNSLHFRDIAGDVRSHDLDKATSRKLLAAARVAFDYEYGIILEYEDTPKEHYHVQLGMEGLKLY